MKRKFGLAKFGLLAVAISTLTTGVCLAQAASPSSVVKVGIQNQYAPLNYVDPDTKEFTGFNVDLFEALSTKMGIEMELVVASFPDLVPGLDTARFDLIGAGLTDTPSRRETLSFIDYLANGAVLITTKEQQAAFTNVADVCGHSVAHSRIVASYGQMLERFNQSTCSSSVPAEVVTDDLPVQLGLAQGRYETALIAQELYLYLEKSQPGKYVQIGDVLEPTRLGIAFRKEDTQLRDAIKDGLQDLVDSGQYAEILEKYGMSAMAVDTMLVDP